MQKGRLRAVPACPQMRRPHRANRAPWPEEGPPAKLSLRRAGRKSRRSALGWVGNRESSRAVEGETRAVRWGGQSERDLLVKSPLVALLTTSAAERAFPGTAKGEFEWAASALPRVAEEREESEVVKVNFQEGQERKACEFARETDKPRIRALRRAT